MALEKLESGSERKFVSGRHFRFEDCFGLIVIATAQIFVLLLLIPLPLVAPVLSLLSFVMACSVALYALSTNASRNTQGLAIWNIAYAFALTWIVTAVMSKPRHVLDWFDNLSVVP